MIFLAKPSWSISTNSLFRRTSKYFFIEISLYVPTNGLLNRSLKKFGLSWLVSGTKIWIFLIDFSPIFIGSGIKLLSISKVWSHQSYILNVGFNLCCLFEHSCGVIWESWWISLWESKVDYCWFETVLKWNIPVPSGLKSVL